MPADIAYFNTANLAPQLHAVRTADEAALERRAKPWTTSAADWFDDSERLRDLFGRIVGAGMAIAALAELVKWGVPRVAQALAGRTADIARRATDLGLDPLPEDQRGPHMLGVRLPEPARKRVLPALANANCFAAVRGASLRIAPHLHTTDEDVARLFGALATALQPIARA